MQLKEALKYGFCLLEVALLHMDQPAAQLAS